MSQLFSRTRLFLSVACPPLPPPRFRPLSGTGPPSSEWNEDGLRSKPFPPAWPLHTATLCRQQNHLLQGIECVPRYYLSVMIKYERNIFNDHSDYIKLTCSSVWVSFKIFSYDANFDALVFNMGSRRIYIYFFYARCFCTSLNINRVTAQKF